ncbi:MAG: hypothetical protein H4O13_04925 [Xanthomonadales bacterium]|nr:hypothetical protein [Xanthomonadales bacterium]
MLSRQLPSADVIRHALGYALLGAWLLSMAWAFWLVEGRDAYARAQLASDPQRLESIEAWGAAQGAGRIARPLLILLPSACDCATHAALTQRLMALAATRDSAAEVIVAGRTSPSLLPPGAGAALFNAQGRLLFAGPLESPLHCSDGRSLVEMVLAHAGEDSPPLWAAVIDEPCACDGRYLTT